MEKYSGETIRKVIETLQVEPPNPQETLLYEAFLQGLHFGFADNSVDLDDPDVFFQLIMYLKSVPETIKDAVLEELPDLHIYFLLQITVREIKTIDLSS